MSYATLMVHLEPGHSNKAVLDVAARLASRFKARAIGIAACQPLPVVYGDGVMSGELMVQYSDEMAAQILAAQADFVSALETHATALEWRSAQLVASVNDYVVTQARCADLIITGVATGDLFDSSHALSRSDLVLRAPGMLALHIALDTVELPVQVTVWNDTVKAYDMGDLAAQWFSDFLGPYRGGRLRLARFDPEQRRLSDRRWTGPIEAENAFADAFPLLVASTAGLEEFNRRMVAAGHAPVTMQRFRPNLVLDGLEQPHDEDLIDELVIDTPDGPVRLRLVKPCARCSIPDVDPATGEPDGAVGTVLAGYRIDPRVDGGITFGMNAVIVEGVGRTLRVGASVSARFAV